MNPREAFFQALTAMKEQRFDDAENTCKQLLSINPNEVNTLRLYGQVRKAKGALKEAEEVFSNILTMAPDYAHAHMDLGLIHQQNGNLKSAAKSLEQALTLDKKLHSARRTLFDVYQSLGDKKNIAKLAAELETRDHIANKVKQAYQLAKEHPLEEIERLCREILEEDPGNLAIISLLAEHIVSDRQAQRASRLFEYITHRTPESWRAWNGAGKAKIIQDQIEEGIECFDRSLEINPNATEANVLKADAFTRQYRYNNAITLLKSVLKEHPEHNPALSQLGLALKTIGQQDEAIDVLRRCIKNDEYFGEAYWTLSDMKTFKFNDDEVEAMDRIFWKEKLTGTPQVQFGYALGKALEHRKDYKQSFACYREANRVKKSFSDYSAAGNQQHTDLLIQLVTRESIQRFKPVAITDVTPIFVVGLPRSGSTLQEQILASHSQVEGTQELSYMPRLANGMHLGETPFASNPFPQAISELSDSDINTIGKHYLQQSEKHRLEKKPYFIDKLPNNFVQIGLILLCFPNAKIINTVRHPMDNCLGCFKQLWALGQHFTYSLEDLGHYYNDYHRLMKHWHEVFPNKILDVQYESVVDDLDSNVRRVLDFCGLEFEQACLNFHETKRVVKTSSSEQVRKPIYRSALAYWKNFEEELQPLREILGDLVTD